MIPSVRTICAALALLLALLFVSLSAGCKGVTFGNAPMNEELPSDFKNRNLLLDTAIFKYNLQELPGYIIKKDPGSANYNRIKRLLKPGTSEPEVKAIEKGEIYRSKLDQKASAKGSYLAFTATMNAEQRAEAIILDAAQAFIQGANIPWDDLAALAKKKPAGEKWYYIQGVLLSVITVINYTKIDTSASGVIGDTFGVGSDVFNERSGQSRDFAIALALLDIDDLGGIDPSLMQKYGMDINGPLMWSAKPSTSHGSLENSLVHGLQIEMITDK